MTLSIELSIQTNIGCFYLTKLECKFCLLKVLCGCENFDLSIGRFTEMIYIETLETRKFAFNISEFGKACNYIPDYNNKTA